MRRKIPFVLFVYMILLLVNPVHADDGYRLWLKYNPVSDQDLLKDYRESIKAIVVSGQSETMKIAANELETGLSGLLGQSIPQNSIIDKDGCIVAGAFDSLAFPEKKNLKKEIATAGDEGFVIARSTFNGKQAIVITANQDIGVLYGVFHFLKLLQTHQNISSVHLVSSPKMRLRMLNHWDMLNRTHEYRSLLSIWDWHTLPDYIKPVYRDYARANASIGINATSLNCVDADPRFLLSENLLKIKALADLFRPYGIKMFMSPNFSAPIKLGGMQTADPDDPAVHVWWAQKVKEIYTLIPDFGGFLVKANSEDEPGPADFGKSQAAGANMFAEVLKPYNGLVIWRTFVYDYNPQDRAREAYDIFQPLDKIFADNVLLQVKNGPLDFQPREPFTALFGAMPHTPLMMEVDITNGWLESDISMGFMAPMWQETLESDTYAKGKGSTVAKVIDGSLHGYPISGMAGVANVYWERNWTGNLFGQANWYTFGRLAWNPETTAEQIAEDWIRMTFSNDTSIINPIKTIMMRSREDIVNYKTPLGLHMIGGWGGYWGPWVNNSEHATWNSPYYHKADSLGIGFDRTAPGSNAVEQYFPPVAKKFASLETCPEEYLLWFHHVPWNYPMKSGKTLWMELCEHYYAGVDGLRKCEQIWDSIENKIDPETFVTVKVMMKMQERVAVQWRDGCVLYFQSFSKMPIPAGLEKPEHDLDYFLDYESNR